MKHHVFGAASALAMLSACGGDSPPPTNAGAPTPTPAETPSPTYAKLAELSGDWSYLGLGCSKPGSRFKILGLANPSEATIQIDYDSGRDQFRIWGDGYNKTFGTSDLEDSSANYRRYSRLTSTGFEGLSLFLPVANADLTKVAEYSAFFDFTTSDGQMYGCPFGEQTRQGDLPRTNISYETLRTAGVSTIPGGGTFLINGSKISVMFDSAAKTVTVDLDVTVFDASRREVSVGKYSGTFSVDQTTGQFSGRPTGTGLVSTDAEISGAMFGPQGKEMIVTFAFNTQLTPDYYTQIAGETFLITP